MVKGKVRIEIILLLSHLWEFMVVNQLQKYCKLYAMNEKSECHRTVD